MTRARSLSQLANSNVFSVDANNSRVGIGSTVPTVKLDVGGDMNVSGTLTYEDVTNVETTGIITAAQLVVTGVGATFAGISTFLGDIQVGDKIIHTGDTNTAIRFPAADTFTVETAGSERVRVDSNGNVGIGTTIPAYNLEVFGDSALISGSSAANLILEDRGVADASNPFFLLSSDGGQLLLNTADRNASGTTTNSTERLRMDTSGNVGIGENSPADLLHLKSASGNANVRLTTGNTSSGFTAVIFGDTDDTNTGAVQYDHSNNSLQFEVNNSERMRIHAGGTLSVSTGIELGSGLDGTSANTLDDYEEGTWTPDVRFGNSNTGITYSMTGGLYTKIGRQVICYGAWTLTSKGSATGSLYIYGLPFNASDVVGSTSIEGGLTAIYQNAFSGTHVGPIVGGVINGQSYIEMFRQTSTSPGSSGSITNANVTDSTQFRFMVVYTTDS